jgi:protein tyrosine phosphatase type 4A
MQPTEGNLEAYIKEMKAHNVRELVRACECHYPREKVEEAGIRVHDMLFNDGDPPPADVIRKWLTLCTSTFAKGNAEKKTISVHCVAGLGRAPVLVAIALIEDGMEPLEAVQKIRAKRRGAINAKQLQYLEHSYKRQKKSGCCLM